MSGLPFILTPTGRARLINPENTGTSGLTISHVGVSASDAGVVGGVLQGEIKRLDTFAGQVVADDTIHVTIRDDSADVYFLRAFALYFEDGTLMGWHAQPTVILEKSAQAMLLMSGDIQFQNLDVTTLIFGDSNWTNPVATTTVFGVLRLATNEAAIAGTSVVDAVTPAGLLATLNARFGSGAPSDFVKGLLNLATAALFRAAIGLGSASIRNEGANNGLDSDLLDGQHGAYYRDWGNLTGKPGTFPPSAHGHAWADVSGVPSTATRWPSFAEVTDKPATYSPSAHIHAAADVTTGVFDVARIPDISQSKVTGLAAALDSKANLAGQPAFTAGIRARNSDNAWGLLAETTTGVARGGLWYEASGISLVNSVSGFKKLFLGNDGSMLYDGQTIWRSGNFDPVSKVSKAGDVMTGDLSIQKGVATLTMISASGAAAAGRGYRLLSNVADSVDFGLQFDRWTGSAWQTKALLNTAGFSVNGQMVATLANGAQYRATANGANFFDFGIGATTTNDPDAYWVNRANGGILIYTNNSPRGKFLADGVFEWYSSIRTKGAAAGLEIEGRDNSAHIFTCYYQAGSFRLYSTVAASDVFAVTTGGETQSLAGFRNTSSERVKDIEGPNPYGLEAVMALRTVVGRYKQAFVADDARRLFLVAENVAANIEGPVAAMDGVEFEGEAVLGLDYNQIVPVLVKAIQEQQGQIDTLRRMLRRSAEDA
ncbi:hypothetical protein [Pseudoxanthomonas mexicana]